MASIEFAYEEAKECSLLLLLLVLLLLVVELLLGLGGDMGKGENPSSENSSTESLLLLPPLPPPLPLRAANFNAFNNMGDSGATSSLSSSVVRLGVAVLSSLPLRRRRCDILERDFALGLGVWGA